MTFNQVAEIRTIERLQEIATPFVARAIKEPPPWVACAGPSTWEIYGKSSVPVYVLELDTTRISAGRLVSDKHLLHDISTAAGGQFRLRWKNHLGLGLVFDARPEPKVNLLEVLAKAERVLVVGDSDAGKTTLLQHAISRRINHQLVIVLDPHAEPGQWLNAKVVGAGLDFPRIAKVLDQLTEEMKQRYQRRAVGDNRYRPLMVVVDEWMSIALETERGGEQLISLLTQGRKVKMYLFVGTHSQNVKAMKLEGRGDLRDNFIQVHLYVNQVTKARRATVDFGEGELPAVAPGPFVQAMNTPPANVIELPPSKAEEEEEKMQEFVRLVRSGACKSKNEACWKVFGRAYGGDLVNKCREALGEI